MSFLLFGRDGQVGGALYALLPEALALGRAEADFEQPGRLAELVRQYRPSVILNAVAYTAVDKAESEPELAQRINADAVGELAEVAAETGAWLIHYSTDYVFDGSQAAPYLETDASAPLNVYGSSKRDGELAISASGTKALIFRTSWVHARGSTVSFAAKMLQLAQSRDTLSVIDDQYGAPTSADLIAEITVKALRRITEGDPIEPGVYHLAAAGETTWNGYARFVVGEAMALGAEMKAGPDAITRIPSSAYKQPAARPLNSRLGTAKLSAALGVTFPDWRLGVRDTVHSLVLEQAH